MNTAKKIRLSRILNRRSGRSIIVPIDHGLTLGPIQGLESSGRMAAWLLDDHIDAVIAHKGMVVRLVEKNLLRGRGVILHLNGMSVLAKVPDDKEMLTSIESAANLGVDAVSVQINFTDDNDSRNWRLLGRVVDEAARAGLPVVTMLYDKVFLPDARAQVARFRQLLRVAVELGTDAIKIATPTNFALLPDILEPVVDDAMVFLAGGEAADTDTLLGQMAEAVRLGAAGVCMGRNVFGSRDPKQFLSKLSRVVHGPYAGDAKRTDTPQRDSIRHPSNHGLYAAGTVRVGASHA